MCPALSDPMNGIVTWTSLTVGGVATYVCDDGFELDGSMTRTCESSGMWSGEKPVCRGMLITPVNEQCFTSWQHGILERRQSEVAPV